MLAGAHPQPRLDRVLARCIDLVAYGILGFGNALRPFRSDGPPRAFSSGETLTLAVLTVLLVMLYEVGPFLFRKPSPGKQLFALRIESSDGEPVTLGQMLRRAMPLLMLLTTFLVSLRTSIEVWWLTLGLTTVFGLVGLLAIVRDRSTPWDRLAGTRVVSVPAEW